MSSKKKIKPTSGESKPKPTTQTTSTTNASATKDLKARIEQLENENNKLRTELKQQLKDNHEQYLSDGDFLRGMIGQDLHKLELKIQSLEKAVSSQKILKQSTFERGSDEVTSKSEATDICAYCANNDKLQPALYICFDCRPFGRLMCGDCNKQHTKFGLEHVVADLSHPIDKRSKLENMLKEKETEIEVLKKNARENRTEFETQLKEMSALNNQSRTEVKELRDELDIVKRALKTTEKELDKYINIDTFSKSNSSEKENEAQKALEKVNAAVKEKEAAINELEKMERKCKQAEEELDKLRKTNASHSSEKEKEAQKALETVNAAVKEKEAETKKLKEKLKKAEEEVEKLRNASLEATSSQKVGEENVAALSEINSLKEEIKKKVEEVNKLKTAHEENSKNLQQTIDNHKNEIETLKKEKARMTKEHENLNNKIKDMESSREREGKNKDAGQLENQRLTNELKDLQSKLDKMTAEKESFSSKSKEENQRLANELKVEQSKLKKVTEEKENLSKTIEQLRKENTKKDSKQVTSANGNTKENLIKINQELKDAKEEISELKNRLSKVVGAKVMDDNPNITDLSDENRPTKLSEKFSELYDNEWTDAYEEFENNNKSEMDIIRELYALLVDINDICQKLAMSHADNIKASVLSVPSAVNGRPKTPQIGVTQTRLLKELRKTFAPFLVDSVFQHYVKTKKIETKGKPKTEAFVKECVRICWLMNAQDPPVVLDTSNVNGNFDDNRFRTYTKSGKTVDYVVWPPLLLHKDGPLLCKGVAQGK